MNRQGMLKNIGPLFAAGFFLLKKQYDMKKKINIRKKKFLADTVTPVGIYLKLRDKFANSILLESSDYHGAEDSFSYICCLPVATFESTGNRIRKTIFQKIDEVESDPLEELKLFAGQFDHHSPGQKPIETGLFGYISYDSVRHFEQVEIVTDEIQIPEIKYSLYKFIIALDHFKNEGHLIESYFDTPDDQLFSEIFDLVNQQSIPQFNFKNTSSVRSDMSDEEYMEAVKSGIRHCNIGDVFQVVFSRKFETDFKGDEFQVYRALRSINPSPYLFYFDFGSYKLFGSSPEAQIVVNQNEAIIYPIAGTFKRTGDDQADAELAKKLLEDPKENAEHIMLVDLARNDLSKNTDNVEVETYKEIQYFSHVIHLVSKVTGKLKEGSDPLQIMANTFPAGTLSGAPKIKAMQLINQYEKSTRGYYGGAIGFMDFSGNINHAIMIRTFLSNENMLTFRAGAGIVSKSDPESELKEVYNKLAALNKALEVAEKL